MTIKLPINNFLHEIFPKGERSSLSVKKTFSKMYTQGVVKTKIAESNFLLIASHSKNISIKKVIC